MDGLHSTGLAVLEGDGVEDLSRVVGDESDVGQDQLPLVVGRMAWVLREVLLHDEEGSRACGKWQQRVDNQLDLFHFLLILRIRDRPINSLLSFLFNYIMILN